VFAYGILLPWIGKKYYYAYLYIINRLMGAVLEIYRYSKFQGTHETIDAASLSIS